MVRNFTNAPLSNESLNINIPKTAQDEANTANHKLKENGGIDLETTETVESKSYYEESKEIVSGLTDQPILSTYSIEEPSSNLTITIMNETTASVEWFAHYPGEYTTYLPGTRKIFQENIVDVEKGIEQLFLQDIEDIKITEGEETLIVTFDLKGNYTNNFVTGKCRYMRELVEYAPLGINALTVIMPQNKTLVSVNPGPNEIEGNELTYYNYNWIYPLDIRYTEKALAGVTKANIGDEWELPELPSSANILGLGEERALGLGEVPTNEYSRFAEPDLWVGTGSDPVPGTSPSRTAYEVANDYKPWLYNRTDQCSDNVYYRVVKGYDSYAGFDAYLIQYFGYWRCQDPLDPITSHEHDYEPICTWSRNATKKFLWWEREWC